MGLTMGGSYGLLSRGGMGLPAYYKFRRKIKWK